MSAYIVIDLTVKDADQLGKYSSAAPTTLAKFKGEFLTKGKIQSLHGAVPFQNKAILQFPDKESALNWYNSPEYQALIELRNSGMDSQFHLVA
ncbi:MAG: DUF1330 domain-containing protein [Noviherbaspirillum sp.]